MEARNIRFKGVHDEHLIRRELYNPNEFTLILKRDTTKDTYIARNLIPLGPENIILQPDEFILVPHFYWIIHAKNGADQINLIQNFGNEIGKGNKKPSRPDVKLT